MELDATHQFTFGMSAASYTNMDGETVSCATGDGQNLFDTDHTISDGTGSYDNLITTAFSRAGLEEMEVLFTKFVDDNGSKVVVEPDTIVTTDTPSIINAVKEFAGSALIPDEANNAMNVYKGKYKHLVLPYLTTDANGDYSATPANYWMLADLKATDAIMEISENPTFTAPSSGGNGEEFETDKLQLSLLWETIVEKFSKLRETLSETIRSQAQKWEGSTTIMGTSFGMMG
jgi:hypothetical protein